MIDEQIKNLRELATDTEYDTEELHEALNQAANTIEILFSRLIAANIGLFSQNTDDYNGGSKDDMKWVE